MVFVLGITLLFSEHVFNLIYLLRCQNFKVMPYCVVFFRGDNAEPGVDCRSYSGGHPLRRRGVPVLGPAGPPRRARRPAARLRGGWGYRG